MGLDLCSFCSEDLIALASIGWSKDVWIVTNTSQHGGSLPSSASTSQSATRSSPSAPAQTTHSPASFTRNTKSSSPPRVDAPPITSLSSASTHSFRALVLEVCWSGMACKLLMLVVRLLIYVD